MLRRELAVSLEQAPTLESFVRAPVGRWVMAGSAIGWCYSPTLCGCIGWGRPDAAAVRAILHAFEAYRELALKFDVILDGRLLEAIPADGLEAFLEWARRELEPLQRRIRVLGSVIPPGPDGFTLAGIGSVLGFSALYTTDPVEAFRRVLPDGGDALAEEVAGIVSRVRGTPPILVKLHSLLRDRQSRISLAEAARALGISARQLQRELAGAGKSFRGELFDVRFDSVTRLLSSTDDKLASVAAQLGISSTPLAQIVRDRTGQSLAEYRASLRNKR
jgi:AraC-like DNA-binding protein